MHEAADVLVIGAGPSGLGAAIGLRRRGVGKVVVVEREATAGGVPRHCAHPPFGMLEFARVLTGPDYARRLVARAHAAGVDIRTQHTVTALEGDGRVGLTTPKGVCGIAATRIVLATGMRETTRAARLVSGERPQGVLNTGAFQALVNLKGIVPFRRPVIVGTELVGLSAISTCRKHGIRPAAVIEANPAPSAPWPLGLYPSLLGIPAHFGAEIVDIAGKAQVESVSIRSADGTVTRIACDGIIFSGQFVGENTLGRFAGIETALTGGGPVLDDHGRTSDPAIFAVGNLVHPAETAGWCYREGARMAAVIADDLKAPAQPPVSAVDVRAGAGVRFTVPGRIALASQTGVNHLHVWPSPQARGTLQVRAGTDVLWTKRILGQPARRYDIPLALLKTERDISKIDVTIE